MGDESYINHMLQHSKMYNFLLSIHIAVGNRGHVFCYSYLDAEAMLVIRRVFVRSY